MPDPQVSTIIGVGTRRRTVRRSIEVLALVACVFAASCASGSQQPSTSSLTSPQDWVQRGYDGGHGRSNPAETVLSPSNVGDLAVGWRTRIRPTEAFWIADEGVDVGAVVGDRVFVSWASDEAGGSRFAVLDARDGRIVWQRQTATSAQWFAGVAGSTAIISSYGQGVEGVDATNGEPRWSFRRASALAIDPTGATAFVATDARISAVSVMDGSERWSRAIRLNDRTMAHLIDGVLVVSADLGSAKGSEMIAIDAATGDTRWEASVACAVGPAAEGRIFTWCGPSGKNEGEAVTAWSAVDGTVLWTHAFDGFTVGGSAGAGVLMASSLRCVSGCEGDAFGRYEGILTALDAATGQARWTLPASGSSVPPWTSGPIANGLVYVHTLRDVRCRIGAVSLENGTLVWSDQVGTEVSAMVDVVARGTAYVTTAYGLHDPIGGTLIAYRLPSRT
jgi:outer membrane protein assembly factor BamB